MCYFFYPNLCDMGRILKVNQIFDVLQILKLLIIVICSIFYVTNNICYFLYPNLCGTNKFWTSINFF